MLIEEFKTILVRDLEKLVQELQKYPETGLIWTVLPGTVNSAGNLVLHLAGNLSHFIGATLGNTGYMRNREAEFSVTGLSIDELTDIINKCRVEVQTGLNRITVADLVKPFPLEISGIKSSTGYLLIHLVSHFNYHLGQINYHRRTISPV